RARERRGAGRGREPRAPRAHREGGEARQGRQRSRAARAALGGRGLDAALLRRAASWFATYDSWRSVVCVPAGPSVRPSRPDRFAHGRGGRTLDPAGAGVALADARIAP